MASPEEFARECRDVSRQLRRLPTAVRKALRARVKDEVAEPMASDIRAGGRTLYTRRVAATAKVRSQADPTIVVGGTRKLASGGATGRDLVFGAQFGGGSRVTALPPTARRRGHRRRTTRQFIGARDPFVFATVGRRVDDYLEMWANIVDETVEQEVSDHG